jgi:hypothetical protein
MKECDNRKNTYKQQLHIVYMTSNNVGHRVTRIITRRASTRIRRRATTITGRASTRKIAHRLSFPNARCEGHGVWNEVLFKCPRIQVAPWSLGEHYDVITAMRLFNF